MIYDHEGLEEHYDTTIVGINDILDELHANHDHITPALMVQLEEAYGLLGKIKEEHERNLKIWEIDNS